MRFPDLFRTKEEDISFWWRNDSTKQQEFLLFVGAYLGICSTKKLELLVFVGNFWGLDSTKKYLFFALVGISATFCSYKRGKT